MKPIINDLISRKGLYNWVKKETNPYTQPTLGRDSGLKVMEMIIEMPSAANISEVLKDTYGEICKLDISKLPKSDAEKIEYIAHKFRDVAFKKLRAGEQK